MASGINIGGVPVEQFVKEMTTKTSKAEALKVTGKILLDAGYEMGRTFSYGATFAKTDPGCGAKFARKLDHDDWKDGEDLVQAEESTGEMGFNVRFHWIEDDLDSLGVDVKKAFSCLAEMRSSLSDRLAEIREEINLINQDLKRLQTCCEEREQYAELAPEVRYLGQVPWYGTWLQRYQIGGQTVLMPPTPPQPPIANGAGDPRVRDVEDLARFLNKDKNVKQFFKDKSVSKREFVEKFGHMETEGGRPVGELVDILSEQGRYSSPESFLKAVSDRQAAAIRTSGQLDHVINTAFAGNVTEGAPLSEAAVDSFQLIPERERQAISAAGVETLGELAAQTPKGLAKIMDKAGFEVGEDEAAGWTAAAEMMMHTTH
jgi:hypothetical protein